MAGEVPYMENKLLTSNKLHVEDELLNTILKNTNKMFLLFFFGWLSGVIGCIILDNLPLGVQISLFGLTILIAENYRTYVNIIWGILSSLFCIYLFSNLYYQIKNTNESMQIKKLFLYITIAKIIAHVILIVYLLTALYYIMTIKYITEYLLLQERMNAIQNLKYMIYAALIFFFAATLILAHVSYNIKQYDLIFVAGFIFLGLLPAIGSMMLIVLANYLAQGRISSPYITIK